MDFVSYRAEHLERLDLQEGQQYLRQFLPQPLREVLEGEFSFTALDGGEVVACGGLAEQWNNRAIAWAYLGDVTPRRFVAIDRMARRLLDVAPFERVEATADVGFEPGHRWLKALGFELEAPLMRKHRPDGGDSALYARIR